MKYKVKVIETLSTVIDVEANSEDEALAVVKEDYCNGNIDFLNSPDDTDDVDFTICQNTSK